MATSTASTHTSLKAFQAEIDKVKSDAQKARHEHELRLAAEQASSHGQKKHALPKPSHAQVEWEKAFKAQAKEAVKKVGEAEVVDSDQQIEHVEAEETIEVRILAAYTSEADSDSSLRTYCSPSLQPMQSPKTILYVRSSDTCFCTTTGSIFWLLDATQRRRSGSRFRRSLQLPNQ